MINLLVRFDCCYFDERSLIFASMFVMLFRIVVTFDDISENCELIIFPSTIKLTSHVTVLLKFDIDDAVVKKPSSITNVFTFM